MQKQTEFKSQNGAEVSFCPSFSFPYLNLCHCEVLDVVLVLRRVLSDPLSAIKTRQNKTDSDKVAVLKLISALVRPSLTPNMKVSNQVC